MKAARLLDRVGPGLLVAATGVGAGDLATSAFAGSRVGLSVLWAVVAGAAMKLLLTEGIARYQLRTGATLLEGLGRSSRLLSWAFLPYLVLWSFFVGAALISACGVTAAAMLPALGDAASSKLVYGAAHSLVGLALVLGGSFRGFERVMAVGVGTMFVAVLLTALLLEPDPLAVARGLSLPSLSTSGESLTWTIALIGGVGGTLTILSYGYWIREQGWAGESALPKVRWDLSVGYAATALFGLSMVVIGNQIPADGKGAGLIVGLAGALDDRLGAAGRWVFLIGAYSAVASSLLGVWQGVPYLFADTLRVALGKREPVHVASKSYRAYAVALAVLPLSGLTWSFERAQKLYALVGASFVPLLAIVLLVMNRRTQRIPLGNGPLGVFGLVATLAFFSWAAVRALCD